MKNVVRAAAVTIVLIPVFFAANLAIGQQTPSPEDQVFVKLIKKTDLDNLRTIRDYMGDCDGKTNLPDGLDLYISADDNGKLVANTKVAFYARIGRDCTAPDGKKTTCWDQSLIPENYGTLSELLARCKDARRKELSINYLVNINLSTLILVPVPRFIEWTFKGEDYLEVIGKSLVPKDIFEDKPKEAQLQQNIPSGLANDRDNIIKLKSSLNWEKGPLPLASYKEIDVPLVAKNETNPAKKPGDESKQKKVWAYRKGSLTNQDAVKDYINKCIKFWKDADDAIMKKAKEPDTE